LAGPDEVLGGLEEELGDPGGAGGGDAGLLEGGDHDVRGHHAGGGVTEAGEGVLAGEGLVPGDLVRVVEAGVHVKGLEDLEAGGFEGGGDVLVQGNVGEAVADLDSPLELLVLGVVGVVLGGHDPLVAAKQGSGLEDLEDLLEGLDLVRGVAGGLDGVGGVVAVLGEGDVHEVALGVVAELGEAGGVDLLGAALDLVVVVVEAGDLGAGELGDVPKGATNTAADIEDPHALLEAQLEGEEVLGADDGLLEGLALVPLGKVEALAPSVLVKVCKTRRNRSEGRRGRHGW